MGIHLLAIFMRKNEKITVRSENGMGVNCPIVDFTKKKLWVRFPTNQVLEMDYDEKRQLFVGRMARLEFTVDVNNP
jgi:hypothetical protein